MNPEHIPCNALIVGPTGCGKTQFVVEQLLGPFRYKFDYIVLLCPTYVNNKTWGGIGIADDDFFVDILDPMSYPTTSKSGIDNFQRICRRCSYWTT